MVDGTHFISFVFLKLYSSYESARSYNKNCGHQCECLLLLVDENKIIVKLCYNDIMTDISCKFPSPR